MRRGADGGRRGWLLAGMAAGLMAGTTPSLAGKVYTPPAVTAGETVAAPDDLRRDASALLKAARAKDAAGVAAFLAPTITEVSGSLDLAAERRASTLTEADPIARLAALGRNGEGGDIPPDTDVTAFLHRLAFGFIVQSLTDGRPWGRDPMVADAVCSYAAASYDRRAVAKAAKRLGVAASSFVAVTAPVTVLARPEDGAPDAGRLAPGALYAIDHDAGEPIGWTAVHLPAGGSGFLRSDAWQTEQPYTSGICFRQAADGVWRVVAQAATGL